MSKVYDDGRDCNSCKYKQELTKQPQERDLNCQQCHAAERICGIKLPNYEPEGRG